MPGPFVFKKVVVLVEATGRHACSLDELLRTVLIVPPSSIGYHMHREFLASRTVLPEYPNDFAMWSAKLLGNNRLAERFANLRVFKHRTLESLQAELARLIAEELVAAPTGQPVLPRERAFHFATSRSLILDCHRSAADLDELRRVLGDIDGASLYYHLFETRFAAGPLRQGDFAEWIGSLGHQELAARVAGLDPYMFSIENARRAILAILGGPLRPLSPPPSGESEVRP